MKDNHPLLAWFLGFITVPLNKVHFNVNSFLLLEGLMLLC